MEFTEQEIELLKALDVWEDFMQGDRDTTVICDVERRSSRTLKAIQQLGWRLEYVNDFYDDGDYWQIFNLTKPKNK